MKNLFFTVASQSHAVRWFNLAIIALFLFVPGVAIASTGLAEYEQPWEICALCHSLDGNSQMSRFPKLAGQRKEYIEKQLGDFLNARRLNDGGQMATIVTEIDPVDFGRIAEWFSSQEPPAPGESEQSEIAGGEALYFESGCAGCHNRTEQNPSSPPMPFLTSQHAAYLAKQLTDFQRDLRLHVKDENIVRIINGFSQQELISISTYLSVTPR